ncbi:HAD family phosphatase [Cellulomonas cellasea]|uniref:HAD family hydrolase n=1 Tax=Cellulomonas cellasea TaxID=43670 RepID=UPI0025A39FE9|nr:HAD family phosphatase [Cellulomonas cellasea]MDM8083894.1 HAD family phosphatase [Cellulomonas cellasea]
MTSLRPPKAVVFDLGNVLVRWDPRLPFVGSLTSDEVDAMFEEVDFAAFNHLQDAGRPWAVALASIRERHPQHAAAMTLYRDNFAASLAGPVPGSERVVRDLRATGVRLLGLTNWSAETFPHAEPAAPVIGLLEDVLVSGEVGLAKPDPRIFRLLAERHGLDPEATVFVDDSAANVEAAAGEGFDALLFTDAERLRADLAERGLPV